MNEKQLPDPLEDFLSHPPILKPDLELRESLLEASVRRLHNRRAPRWPWLLAGAAAIALVFGAACAYFLARSSMIPQPVPVPDLVERFDIPHKEAPIPPMPPREEVLVKAPPSPCELENRAFDAAEDTTRVQLYFQAGDIYLTKFEDVRSAMRCYQQAILYCDANHLEINPNDNWLVMALKRDQRKEKQHAHD